MASLKDVIYISNEDYETLVSTGTVTIDGVTLTYDENNVYITPDKLASTTEDGLMSAADKTSLDTIKSAYLKNATVANNTLTITKQDDTTVTFQGGGTDTNQTVKTSSVTFGSDDAVEFVGGGNVTITGNATNKTMTLGVASGYSIPSTTDQTAWTNKYSKPSSGIPASDLEESYYLASNPNGYTSNTGTVTSVGLSMPNIFTVGGSPVTSSGTLTVTLQNVAAGHRVFAGPSSGTAGAPSFRALVADDIPSLTSSKISDLATVATSGSYNDLTDLPTLGALAAKDKISTGDIASGYYLPSQYISQASASGNTLTLTSVGGTSLTYTPTFTEQHVGDVVSVSAATGSGITIGGTTANPTVGIASNYKLPTTTEWNNKADASAIPTVNDATLTIQQNGTNVETFTANASSNKTANIVTPQIEDWRS